MGNRCRRNGCPKSAFLGCTSFTGVGRPPCCLQIGLWVSRFMMTSSRDTAQPVFSRKLNSTPPLLLESLTSVYAWPGLQVHADYASCTAHLSLLHVQAERKAKCMPRGRVHVIEADYWCKDGLTMCFELLRLHVQHLPSSEESRRSEAEEAKSL